LPDRPDYVAFLSNYGSAEFTAQAVRSFSAHSTVDVRQAALPLPTWVGGWSDDWAFWRFGFNACSITDTAFLRHADYHTVNDLPHSIDTAEMAAVVEGIE